MTTLSVRMNQLRKEGYTLDFSIKDDAIINERSQKSIELETIVIDKFFRFEGNSNPSDNSILYAISINTKEKGVIVDTYGVDSKVSILLAKLVS